MSQEGTLDVKSSLGFWNLLFTMNFTYLGTYVSSNSEVEVEKVWHLQGNVYVQVHSYSNSSVPLIGVNTHRHKPGPKSAFGMNVWYGLNIRKKSNTATVLFTSILGCINSPNKTYQVTL